MLATPARDGRKMRTISSLGKTHSLEEEILGTEVQVFQGEREEVASPSRDVQGTAADVKHPAIQPPSTEPPVAGILTFGDGTTVPFVSSLFGQRGDAIGKLVWANPRWAEEELLNAREMDGNIAVVWRGLPPGIPPGSMKLSFVDKAARCIRAGAKAVLVVNNEDRPLAPTGNASVDVPVVCIQKGEGQSIESATFAKIEFDREVKAAGRVNSPGYQEGGEVWNMFRGLMEANEAAMEVAKEVVEAKQLKREMLNVAQSEGLDLEKVAMMRDGVMAVLRGKMKPLQEAMASVQEAVAKCEENVAEKMLAREQRAEKAERHASNLHNTLENVSSKVEVSLRKQLTDSREKVRALEETLWRPEVQEALRYRAKTPHKSLLDRFESSQAVGGGGGGQVFSVAVASDVLGKARPSELGGAADEMLAGKAGELAGTDDENVIKVKAKLRQKMSAKWFGQWYDLVNWRGLQKVLRSLLEDPMNQGPGRLLHVESLLGSFNVELGMVQQENARLRVESERIKVEINEKNASVVRMEALVQGWEKEKEKELGALKAEAEQSAMARERHWEGMLEEKEREMREASERSEEERARLSEVESALRKEMQSEREQCEEQRLVIERLQQRLKEADDARKAMAERHQKELSTPRRGVGGKGSSSNSRVASRSVSQAASVVASRAGSPGLR
jgi:hypothetical protein